MATPQVKLYELPIGELHVTIEGLTPLLMHAWFHDPSTQGIIPAPEVEMERCVYHTLDGRVGFPSQGIKSSMVRGGINCKLKMINMKTSFHVIGGEVIPLTEGSGKPQMHQARVVVGKASITRTRAMVWPWAIELTIRYNERGISAEQLLAALESAGFGVGIGDWRPEKGGTFGMFQIKRD